MHGRIKVKTTAEQEEEKRKEREKKLKIFRKASGIALDKLERKEYDEAGLEVTGQILSKNCDISSMWNYRKSAFNAMKDNSSDDARQKMCAEELEFLASCLRNNPKSYGCWHHRCFIMLSMPKPDWKNELDLCNQFLQFDDRNFHCWDYRRFVVKNSDPKVTVDSEIKCTSLLIENNFSNYSSWHYRSKLLPKQYPSDKEDAQIEEKKLLEELEYVQNAFFTDPNDQSAWFYHQWLLGRGEKNQALLAAHVCRTATSLTCVFRKPVSQTELASKAEIVVDDTVQGGVWNFLISDYVKYQHVWVFKCTEEFPDKDVTISLNMLDKTLKLKLESDSDNALARDFSATGFCQEMSNVKSLVLRSELGSCMELNELEPGNKWVVLTLVQLMYVIDAGAYKNEIEKYLVELQEIDPMRKCYYMDLRSKIVIGNLSTQNLATQVLLNLSNLSLTRLCHLQYLSHIKIVDVSNNLLKKLSEQFHLLLCCEELIADGNMICSISGVKNMPQLVKLSLSRNQLSRLADFKQLHSCPKLRVLSLSGNDFECGKDQIKELLSDVTVDF